MKCTLCDQEITNYNTEFNQLIISQSRTVEICSDCLEKILFWQRDTYAKLFPTKTMKKLRIN